MDAVEASVDTDAPLNLLSEEEDPNVELVCEAEEAVKSGADDGDEGEVNSNDAA